MPQSELRQLDDRLNVEAIFLVKLDIFIDSKDLLLIAALHHDLGVEDVGALLNPNLQVLEWNCCPMMRLDIVFDDRLPPVQSPVQSIEIALLVEPFHLWKLFQEGLKLAVRRLDRLLTGTPENRTQCFYKLLGRDHSGKAHSAHDVPHPLISLSDVIVPRNFVGRNAPGDYAQELRFL